MNHYITEPEHENFINSKIQDLKGSFLYTKIKKGVFELMEKISINQNERKYDIESIRPVTAHVLRIVFTSDMPDSYGDIQIYTSGGIQCSNLPGYGTVYRQEGQTVYLSDDGSVYVAPPEPVQPEEPEPYVPTLEEVQEAKVEEMDRTQQAVVQAGFEVVLTDGTTEHFDLTEKEQKQLSVLQGVIARGDEKIPWHTSDETEHCKYYSNDDMSKVVTAAFDLVTYHETYFRDLRIYIRSLATKEAVEAVTYGTEIPENYRSQPLADMLAGGV